MDKSLVTHKLLEEAVKLAPFDGWSDKTLEQAKQNANITESEFIRACPGGVMDLLDAWVLSADDAMAEFAEQEDISKLKVRERIKALILFRLEHYAEEREAIRRACSLLALPWHMGENLRMLQRTLDRMWRLAGDDSNDYNWYTKRLLLSGVYTSTLMYWLSDDSANFEATKSFLDRRIENVMAINKCMGKVKEKAA